MKNERICIFASVLLLICVLIFVGCNTEEFCKVTFVQGDKTSVRNVKKGSAVTNIPLLQQRKGYTVTWGNVDLSNITSDLTVTAVETPNNYAINLDLNGGICDLDKVDVVFDGEYALPTVTRDGYLFNGWTLNGNPFASLGVWTTDGNVTVKAEWNILPPSEFTVTFVQPGKSPVVRVVKSGTTLTDIPEPIAKKGYTVKWDDKVSLDNITQNLTVNAVETPNVYVINYELGFIDGTIEANKQNVAFDDEYKLYTPTAQGYNFVKWIIKGTDTQFNDGVYTIDTDITLTAVWEEDIWSDFH